MRLLIPLFSPATGTWGGLTRALAVAEAAVTTGHEVAFCASGSVADTVTHRGYRCYEMPSATMLGLPASVTRPLQARSQRAAIPVRSGRSIGSIWLVLTVSGMARPAYLRSALQAQERAAREFAPDAVFTDLDPAAFLLAAVTGIPLASTYSSVMTQGRGTWPWRLMRHGLAQALRSRGVASRTPDELFFGPHVLKIIPSVPELDDADPHRPDVAYVGHLVEPVRPDSLAEAGLDPAGRYVFAYLGTGSIALRTVHRVLPEAFPSAGATTCVVGAQSITAPYRMGGVQFRPYVPAEALLPHCDWTICHGGQNTIIQSLLHGVPLIVFPGPIFERRFNAGKLQQAGAGLMGERNQFTAGWLAAALQRRAELASQAARLGRHLRTFGGADAAIAAIASRLVSAHRPSPRHAAAAARDRVRPAARPSS
jgi:UDP:flavonoid glycosyltransferase YjiC (YdhE family)